MKSIAAAATVVADCIEQKCSWVIANHAPADSACMDGILEAALVVVVYHTENFEEAY
jgi:hypothetical protein